MPSPVPASSLTVYGTGSVSPIVPFPDPGDNRQLQMEDLAGRQGEESVSQTSIPTPGGLPPNFFQLIRQTMRDQILAFCEEGGFVPAGSSLSPPPSLSMCKSAKRVDSSKDILAGSFHTNRGREVLEEGKFLLDDEETEIELPVPASRFQTEDYQYLLAKTVSALDLQFSPEEEDQFKEGTKKKRHSKSKVDFFPSYTPTEKAFPFPEFFLKSRLKHLGVIIDTSSHHLLLPDKARILRTLASAVIQGSSCSLASLAMLVGLMILTLDTVHWVRLYSRELQRFLRPFQAYIVLKQDMRLQVPCKVKLSLSVLVDQVVELAQGNTLGSSAEFRFSQMQVYRDGVYVQGTVFSRQMDSRGIQPTYQPPGTQSDSLSSDTFLTPPVQGRMCLFGRTTHWPRPI